MPGEKLTALCLAGKIKFSKFAIDRRVNPSVICWLKEALCPFLVNAKPEKLLKQRTREWLDGLHVRREAVIAHLFSKVFSGPAF